MHSHEIQSLVVLTPAALDAIRDQWKKAKERGSVSPGLRDRAPDTVLMLCDEIEKMRAEMDDVPPPADAALLALGNRELGEQLRRAEAERDDLRRHLEQASSNAVYFDGIERQYVTEIKDLKRQLKERLLQYEQ